MASNRLLILCVLVCTVMPVTVFAKTYTTVSPAVLYGQYLASLGAELGSTLGPGKANPVPRTTFEEALKAGTLSKCFLIFYICVSKTNNNSKLGYSLHTTYFQIS